MICKVRDTLRKYQMLENTDNVLVGFSGGADSTCLVHILCSLRDEFGFSLHAAHVNHCLRGEESDRDENFVRDFCREYSIKLDVLRADIKSGAQTTGKCIEEYAREVRYNFFNSLTDDKTKIATAHNLNDCEETMLFNLARGSALKGLCSIPAVRDNIIRPLIECSRDEIEIYCKVNHLSFVTDSTNLTDEYTRNKIRHNVIPVLKEINPSFDDSFLRCITSLKDDEDYLKEQADVLYKESKIGFMYDTKRLLQAHIAIRNRVIARIISDKCGVLSEKKHIELVGNILFGGKAEVLCGETLVVRNDRLFFLSDLKLNPVEKTCVLFDKNEEWCNGRIKLTIQNQYTQKVYKELLLSTFDYDKIKGNLVLRKREDGDKITLPGRHVTKSLKKLFNEMKILPEERDNVMIISDDCGIVWIEKVGCDMRVKPDKDTQRFVNIELMGAK